MAAVPGQKVAAVSRKLIQNPIKRVHMVSTKQTASPRHACHTCWSQEQHEYWWNMRHFRVNKCNTHLLCTCRHKFLARMPLKPSKIHTKKLYLIQSYQNSPSFLFLISNSPTSTVFLKKVENSVRVELARTLRDDLTVPDKDFQQHQKHLYHSPPSYQWLSLNTPPTPCQVWSRRTKYHSVDKSVPTVCQHPTHTQQDNARMCLLIAGLSD